MSDISILASSRRKFLLYAGSLTTSIITITGGWRLGFANGDSIETTFLSQHTVETLKQLSKQIFPHDHIEDDFYINVVKMLDQSASNTVFKNQLESGVQLLDASALEPWRNLSEEFQIEILKKIEGTPFFQTIRSIAAIAFYGNPQLWPYFGYEGSSYIHGGYINRGFGDLNWLPGPEN